MGSTHVRAHERTERASSRKGPTGIRRVSKQRLLARSPPPRIAGGRSDRSRVLPCGMRRWNLVESRASVPWAAGGRQSPTGPVKPPRCTVFQPSYIRSKSSTPERPEHSESAVHARGASCPNPDELVPPIFRRRPQARATRNALNTSRTRHRRPSETSKAPSSTSSARFGMHPGEATPPRTGSRVLNRDMRA